MSNFKVLPISDLAEQTFDEWPVWSEHYDYDEIEDIVRWGLIREEVLRLFQQNENGNEHCVYTLLETNPFPERMRIYIKAMLVTANGQSFKGYVINEDAYCISIFHGGREFSFSYHPMSESHNREQEQKLLRSLGSLGSELFPITYKTDYFASNGDRICGVFHYGTRET